jgi:hypothetical protein
MLSVEAPEGISSLKLLIEMLTLSISLICWLMQESKAIERNVFRRRELQYWLG